MREHGAHARLMTRGAGVHSDPEDGSTRGSQETQRVIDGMQADDGSRASRQTAAAISRRRLSGSCSSPPLLLSSLPLLLSSLHSILAANSNFRPPFIVGREREREDPGERRGGAAVASGVRSCLSTTWSATKGVPLVLQMKD